MPANGPSSIRGDHHLLADTPIILLYYYKSLWSAKKNVDDVVPVPDGLIRLQGVNKRPRADDFLNASKRRCAS
jgi:hypothetical protein